MTWYDFDKMIARRNTNCAKWDLAGEELLPLWVADMDFAAPPEVVAALEARARHGVFGYSGGYGGWYRALAQWMKRRYGWVPEQEWVSTSPGVVAALDMLIRALTRPGDGVIIQPPVYRPFFSVVRNNDRRLIENPLYFDGRKYRMDLDQLGKQLEADVKLLILCSPHNPVGRVWTREELLALGQLCLEHEIIVISDEIHSDLIFPGYQHTVLASLSPEMAQNCVVCNAPSKTFNIAGIQASNVIIPNEKIRQAYRQVLRTSGLALPNVFAVTAVEAAYTRGEPWLEELLIYLQANYRFLESFIEEHLPQIKVIEPEGTHLVWLDCRELGLDDQQLDDFIREKAGLLLESGPIFGSGGSGFQRVNIACPRQVLAQALHRLHQAFT